MLYSEKELQRRLKNGCTLFYFYAGEEAPVREAAGRVMHALTDLDPETTTLPGPTPTVEEIVLAAGTISFFGGRRLVYLPLIRAAAYSDRDLKEICATLADSENAVFVLTSVLEEQYGKLRPGKREQTLIAACEKLGYCAQIGKPGRAELLRMLGDRAAESGARFAPGADAALLDLCGEDQYRLQGEVEKLTALAGYGTVTADMVRELGTATLDADTFEMVRLVAAGQTAQALQKLQTLLALQNEPIPIAGALAGNYLDMYRALLTRSSRRQLADMAKDFGYTGRWNYRLENAARTAGRYTRAQLEQCLAILQRLDLDLKSSRLDGGLLLQKAVCELALAREKA